MGAADERLQGQAEAIVKFELIYD